MRPETRYVKTPEGYVGYQTIGAGPQDILFIPDWGTHLEVMWDIPWVVRFFEALSTLGRVIVFDKRGSGVSDPVTLSQIPTLEQWMDDARWVMDEVGSQRAVVYGHTEGGPMAMLFSATHPDRAEGLILVNSFARWRRADDFPIGMPDEAIEKLVDGYERLYPYAGVLGMIAPGAATNEEFRRACARLLRSAMPPGASTAQYRSILSFDVRAVLPTIQAPTLVLQHRGNPHYRVGHGRYLAESIPGAKYVELPGTDAAPFYVPGFEEVVREVEDFLAERRRMPRAAAASSGRVLATVLFTDIVGSTERAAALGDERWIGLRNAHDAFVRQLVERYGGRVVKTIGDGVVATFDGPGRAVLSAAEISRGTRSLGLEVRAGLHTGEIELQGDDVAGIGVHIAARVMAEAGAGDVLVSGTVKDLVVGAGIDFADRGAHALKGVPGEWRLFAVDGTS